MLKDIFMLIYIELINYCFIKLILYKIEKLHQVYTCFLNHVKKRFTLCHIHTKIIKQAIYEKNS